MPKLPKLKTKTVGILVIAGVVLIVLASQMSMDGFQNSTSPAVAAAQTNLANAKNALKVTEESLKNTRASVEMVRNKLNEKKVAMAAAMRDVAEMEGGLQQTINMLTRVEADLVNKQNGVLKAENDLKAAIAAAAAVAPPTNTGCPPPGNQTWVFFHETCPPCFKDMGFDWSRMRKRCQVPNAPTPPPPSQPNNTGCPPKGKQTWVSPFQPCPPCYTNMGPDWQRGGQQMKCQVV